MQELAQETLQQFEPGGRGVIRLPRAPFVQRSAGVIKYRGFELFIVGSRLHPLLELKDNTPKRILTKRLIEALSSLLIFEGPLIDKFLPSSADKVASIRKFIENILSAKEYEEDDLEMGRKPEDIEASRHDLMAITLEAIQMDVKSFETLLDDELNKAPIFCLERIGNLSTDGLLDGAHKGYAPATAALTQECKNEIDEAGRCLAHERPTATGFHILRAVEMTAKQYLKAIPGFKMPSLNRQNWGEYIKLLKDNGADPVVTDTLQTIKNNHRNPLMHPEDALDIWQAVSLFSLCQTMIEALIADMKKRGFIS